MNNRNLIRFDWAIKRLLRNKADYSVLEGNLHYGASMAWTMKVDAEDKIRKDEKIKLAKGLKMKAIDISSIIELTGLSKDEIDQIE